MKREIELNKRPTVAFTDEEHKRIKVFCVENNISMQDFLRQSALYCLEKKIKIKDK